jgi:hypothetical protein
MSNAGDWYKDQFHSLTDALKVRGGWPYWDADAGCWKIRTFNRKPPYRRARAKREARERIVKALCEIDEREM